MNGDCKDRYIYNNSHHLGGKDDDVFTAKSRSSKMLGFGWLVCVHMVVGGVSCST